MDVWALFWIVVFSFGFCLTYTFFMRGNSSKWEALKAGFGFGFGMTLILCFVWVDTLFPLSPTHSSAATTTTAAPNRDPQVDWVYENEVYFRCQGTVMLYTSSLRSDVVSPVENHPDCQPRGAR